MTLLNPFVITVAAPVVFLFGVVAFPIVYFVLRDTVVWLSVLTLYAIVIAEVVLVGRSDPELAWFMAYPTLLAAAAFTKLVFRRRNARESGENG